MLGLFGTLNMGVRSLQTQRQAVETTGHNIANANNEAYSRQRVVIQTNLPLPSPIGPIGTGADIVGITQIRDVLLDRQIRNELSVGGFFEAQQKALQYAQVTLGEEIDRRTAAEGTSSTGSIGMPHGLGDELSNLFNSFQKVSLNPESIVDRQVLLDQAQGVAVKFQEVVERLSMLNDTMNDNLSTYVDNANVLLTEIANLNDRIAASEAASSGTANDMRDIRAQKLEDLSKLVNVDAVEMPNGTINLTIGGILMVDDKTVLEKMELYDAGSGQMLLRSSATQTPLNITSGQMQGIIDVRDGANAELHDRINNLAIQLITEVNAVHQNGFGLDGTTGLAFFTGTDASDIAVNSDLINSPGKMHTSSASGETGNNQNVLLLSQLGGKALAALGNQTFVQSYGQTVASLGQELATANTQLEDHEVVKNMLQQQKISISGVSIDEEMTDLIKYQKAFEASAKLIATIDEMLETMMSIKR